MSHTPGPWFWNDKKAKEGCSPWDIGGELKGVNDKTVMFLEIDNAAKDPDDYEPFFCTTEANARLIAAAPELLEACKSALWSFRKYETEFLNHPLFSELESAINKAESEI